MKPIISLILPAYNVEKYIEACIHSCEKQDIPHSSYEIIIVNDGSTDNTRSLAETLATTYPNIFVVDQSNKGVSVARNNGFKHARGKYIWFIDSDDTISINCLKSLIRIMDDLKLDAFTTGPSIPFISKFPMKFDPQNDISTIYNGVDFIVKSKKFVIGAWCYIFRRDFWDSNNFQFYPNIYYEDTQLMGYVISKASKVAALTSFSCYNYVQRTGSIMHSVPTKQKVLSTAVIVNTHLKFAQEADDPQLREKFLGSASGAFIDGINKIIQMRGDRTLLTTYLASINQRPTYLYGTQILHRIFQYFVLHHPSLFIKLRKLIKLR